MTVIEEARKANKTYLVHNPPASLLTFDKALCNEAQLIWGLPLRFPIQLVKKSYWSAGSVVWGSKELKEL